MVLVLRSNVLGTEENSSTDLEREMKTVKLTFPTTAVRLLVDFLYGLEILVMMEETSETM